MFEWGTGTWSPFGAWVGSWDLGSIVFGGADEGTAFVSD